MPPAVIDPVTASVLEHGLASVTDEMASVIVSTAYSPLVRDVLDFTVALCNPRGEMVVQGVGMAIHLGALPTSVDALLGKFGHDLRPGDVLIVNDAYAGGMHLPNVVLLAPCYAAGELVGHAVVMAHHTDVGGHVPGSVPVNSREIFAEGLRIPPMRLERDGVRNETLLELIELNVRLPRDFFGDLESQVSACRMAEKRLAALAARYGNAAVLGAMDGLLDRAERMARAEITRLPDGDYDFEDWLDSDGMSGPPQRLAVTVRIRGDELTADFTGCAPQVPTAINSPLAYSRSAFYLAVRSIMSPDIPNNAGFFRPLKMIAPEGTIIHPRFPGAVGAMGVTGYRLTDCIFGALAKAAPHLTRAASEGGTTRYTFAASVGGRPSILSEALVGAWGGHCTRDGVDGVANIAANMSNSPVEMVESTYPVLVEEYGYEPDSEGPGRRRGGLGVRRSVRILAEGGGLLQLRSGRAKQAPWGAAGGGDGTPCRNVLDPGTPHEKALGGTETMQVAQGTVYLHVTPGAGGHGPAAAREPELVARDVRDGKISVARARSVYRVAVDARGRIDAAETARLRSAAASWPARTPGGPRCP